MKYKELIKTCKNRVLVNSEHICFKTKQKCSFSNCTHPLISSGTKKKNVCDMSKKNPNGKIKGLTSK
jgi:hypothetical protein